jgi:hypothetical protein
MARPGLEPGTPRFSGSRGPHASAAKGLQFDLFPPGDPVRHPSGLVWFTTRLGLRGRLEVPNERPGLGKRTQSERWPANARVGDLTCLSKRALWFAAAPKRRGDLLGAIQRLSMEIRRRTGAICRRFVPGSTRTSPCQYWPNAVDAPGVSHSGRSVPEAWAVRMAVTRRVRPASSAPACPDVSGRLPPWARSGCSAGRPRTRAKRSKLPPSDITASARSLRDSTRWMFSTPSSRASPRRDRPSRRCLRGAYAARRRAGGSSLSPCGGGGAAAQRIATWTRL